MESSFKKAFERTQNLDGSIELSANSKRLGGLPTLLVLAMVPLSLAPAFLVLAIVDSISKRFIDLDHMGPLGGFIILASAVVTYWYGYGAISNKRSSITIRPKDGLLFDGKQLPFKDIQSIGVLGITNVQGAEGAYVTATSHGNEIRMIGSLPRAVANAIAEQIRADSGLSWG